jgi:xanthine dehydrogenase iron-sulfur cluster and FAD-binding subunit A
VPPRLSATERIRAQIDELFASQQDLGQVLEQVARLSVRLVMQAALEAEVSEFLGRDRYAELTVKTTAGLVVLERPKLPFFPVVSQALELSASAQLRNMATMGGNLMQRTRCGYFREPGFACNKRTPGSGCAARDGLNRPHAVLGGSDHCVATHASDLAVALVALDAVLHLQGPAGRRQMALSDFYRMPSDTPQLENELQPGEMIVQISAAGAPGRPGRTT